MESETTEDVRPIEKFYVRMPVREEEYNDPAVMEVLIDAARHDVAIQFDDLDYEATEEPVVRVNQHMFGGEVLTLDDGTEITYVAQIVATIRGFKR